MGEAEAVVLWQGEEAGPQVVALYGGSPVRAVVGASLHQLAVPQRGLELQGQLAAAAAVLLLPEGLMLLW